MYDLAGNRRSAHEAGKSMGVCYHVPYMPPNLDTMVSQSVPEYLCVAWWYPASQGPRNTILSYPGLEGLAQLAQNLRE